MTCSKGCGHDDHKHSTYGSLKFCDAHRKYDVCGYKAPSHHGKQCCPPKSFKNKCDCDCDKKEECCDEKFVFDCDDLAKKHVKREVESVLAEGCPEIEVSVEIWPKVEHCKVTGFTFEVKASKEDHHSSETDLEAEAKTVTVKTCKDVFCLTKCELEAKDFHLPHDCDCKPSHEIKCVEFCVVVGDPIP